MYIQLQQLKTKDSVTYLLTPGHLPSPPPAFPPTCFLFSISFPQRSQRQETSVPVTGSNELSSRSPRGRREVSLRSHLHHLHPPPPTCFLFIPQRSIQEIPSAIPINFPVVPRVEGGRKVSLRESRRGTFALRGRVG